MRRRRTNYVRYLTLLLIRVLALVPRLVVLLLLLPRPFRRPIVSVEVRAEQTRTNRLRLLLSLRRPSLGILLTLRCRRATILFLVTLRRTRERPRRPHRHRRASGLLPFLAVKRLVLYYRCLMSGRLPLV